MKFFFSNIVEFFVANINQALEGYIELTMAHPAQSWIASSIVFIYTSMFIHLILWTGEVKLAIAKSGKIYRSLYKVAAFGVIAVASADWLTQDNMVFKGIVIISEDGFKNVELLTDRAILAVGLFAVYGLLKMGTAPLDMHLQRKAPEASANSSRLNLNFVRQTNTTLRQAMIRLPESIGNLKGLFPRNIK